MSMRSALYDHLSKDSTLVTLRSTRIYDMVAPTSAVLPYQVYQRISSEHEQHLTASAGLAEDRWQVTTYATTGISAEAIADATREALHGFNGTMGTNPETADVRWVGIDTGPDIFIPASDGSEIGVYQMVQDFIIWHAETVPTFA